MVVEALRTYVRRAINCGVCGRMCTLSWSTFVDTVADGFSSGDLYSGPKCWLGARSSSWPSSGASTVDILRLPVLEMWILFLLSSLKRMKVYVQA